MSFFRLLTVMLLSLSLSAPVAAQARLPDGLVGYYAGFVRSMNPHLAVSECQVYAQDILANARRLRLDPALLTAVVTVESHWNPSARSWRGAEGLGQLMPSTARGLGVDPHSGRENLLGTSIYLHQLLGEFSTAREPLTLAVAGYNAGPGAVMRYGGVPPISETQRYVVKVMSVMSVVHAQAKHMHNAPKRLIHHTSATFEDNVVAYWVGR
jgi:soluble lytic murein transglycosylase-like protein